MSGLAGSRRSARVANGKRCTNHSRVPWYHTISIPWHRYGTFSDTMENLCTHAAFVVGIGDCLEAPVPMGVCKHDAKDIAMALAQAGTAVTLQASASQRRLKLGLMAWFQSLRALGTHTAVVYFSGHVVCCGGDILLRPVDGCVGSEEGEQASSTCALQAGVVRGVAAFWDGEAKETPNTQVVSFLELHSGVSISGFPLENMVMQARAGRGRVLSIV